MSAKGIPTVDLSAYMRGTSADRQAFVAALGSAFREVGFVAVVNHGIPKSLVDRFYAASKAFFALPEEVKRKYEIPGLAGQRGYTSFGREHAKHAQAPDLKEFFQIGQEVPEDHPLRQEYPPNVEVVEVPEFNHLGRELYRAFEAAGAKLLEAIALHLNLPVNYFAPYVTYGNSILESHSLSTYFAGTSKFYPCRTTRGYQPHYPFGRRQRRRVTAAQLEKRVGTHYA